NSDRLPGAAPETRAARSRRAYRDRLLRRCRRRIYYRQALEPDAVVAESGERLVGVGEPAENFRRQEEARLLPQRAEQIAEDEPAGTRFTGRLSGLREALNAAAEIGDSSFLFGKICDRKYY